MSAIPENAIPLPDGLVVECPMTGRLKPLKFCAACEHHRGVTPPRFPGNHDLRFAQQHGVACGYPVARRLLEVE